MAQLLQFFSCSCIANFDFAAGATHQEGGTVVDEQYWKRYVYGGVSRKRADVCLVANLIKIETVMEVGYTNQLFVWRNRRASAEPDTLEHESSRRKIVCEPTFVVCEGESSR